MLGMTWTATLDAALDQIGTHRHNQADALDALNRYCLTHPDAETDPDLTVARIALQ